MQLEDAVAALVEKLNGVREMAENTHAEFETRSGPPITLGILAGDVEALYRLILVMWILDQCHRLGRKAYFESENEKARADKEILYRSSLGWHEEVSRELAARGAPSFKRWHDRLSSRPSYRRPNGQYVECSTLSGMESERDLDDSDNFFDLEDSESDGLSSLLDTDSLQEATRDLEPFLPNTSQPSENNTTPMPSVEEQRRAPDQLDTEDLDRTSGPPPVPAPAPPLQATESDCESPTETKTALTPPHGLIAAMATEEHPRAPPSPGRACTLPQTDVPSSKKHETGGKDKGQRRPNFAVRVLLWLAGVFCCGGVKAEEEQEEERVTIHPEEEHLSSPPSVPPSAERSPVQVVDPPLPSPPTSTSPAALFPSSDRKGRQQSLRTPAKEHARELQVEDIFASTFLLVENDQGILSVEEVHLPASEEDSLKQEPVSHASLSAKVDTPVVSPTEESHNCSFSPSHTDHLEEEDALSSFMDTPEGLGDVSEDLKCFLPDASPSHDPIIPPNSASVEGHRGSSSFTRGDVQLTPALTSTCRSKKEDLPTPSRLHYSVLPSLPFRLLLSARRPFRFLL
uniref:Uncharacterized protein n=1 Tax=Chromera velia CCMP2878 TaxID=1169474 RepID=A0A0G4GQ55_9ALVE|eukprot:Cvel_704.t1-p1 / transcript=Cvel_704.t1 / gene=Cvel_704 / organism=Chromera_velia_CCMP2878 / gene_product=hypothetical protein / transcript_product=hypothetical protein / location=Cvel_scaffold22:12803-14903(-) / protein_length=571 / sequence_SO=supercontig / SO=protein_coding / is_pseudo=false